jgi:hypothetical protein
LGERRIRSELPDRLKRPGGRDGRRGAPGLLHERTLPMATERTTGYGISITRTPNSGWVSVTLRKHFWHVKTGSRSRMVAVTGFLADGMGEREIVESCLRELLRAYIDEIG